MAILKIPMDSVLYNTEYYEMHDDTDDEPSVYRGGRLESNSIWQHPLRDR